MGVRLLGLYIVERSFFIIDEVYEYMINDDGLYLVFIFVYFYMI